MVNVAVILAVGVIFNLPFAWRRYPVYLTRRRTAIVEASELSHGDVVEALRSIDSFIDITEDDLRRLLHILSSRRSHR